MKLRSSGLLASVFLCLSLAHSQEIKLPVDITYAGLVKRVKEIKPSVVSIEVLAGTGEFVSVGTGCVVHVQEANVIVTCRHVVELAKPQGLLAVGLNTQAGKMVVEAYVVRTDSALDLALLQPGEILQMSTSLDTPPPGQKGPVASLDTKHYGIGLSVFADDSAITEGSGVLMVGFPLGLGAEMVSDRPLSRLGMVAQGVYDRPMFLVDGEASHGFSGAPVFLCRSGALAGLVAAQALDKVESFDDSGKRAPSVRYSAGLVSCIPASAIKKFLEAR